MRTTDNNGGKSIDKFDNSNIADLSAIANRNLLDLQMENPDLLVFPHSFGQYKDDVEKPLIVNLGTGIGYSVLDVINAFEKASEKKINYKIVDRRAGDIAKCYAEPSYAKEILDWEAKRTIEDMCADSWRWQSNNPNGYNK